MTASSDSVTLAIIGGSGLYELAGLTHVQELEVATPFGQPSDALIIGEIEGRRVAFLARHGRQHALLPAEINYRANIFALKSIGVRRIISASAVGSLHEDVHPRDIVMVDQFIDRTQGRPSTFFGDGIAAHVSLADPVCTELRSALSASAEACGVRAHGKGTYVCIQGPAFSTRAESELFRSWGAEVIGMTNMQEARLSREAEICYSTMALVTDYDCWHEEEDDVSVAGVLENLKANASAAAAILQRSIRSLSETPDGCGCGRALEHAIITHPSAISAETRQRLLPIVGKYLT